MLDRLLLQDSENEAAIVTDRSSGFHLALLLKIGTRFKYKGWIEAVCVDLSLNVADR